MPKVLARDPAWLARPSPGFQLFHSDPAIDTTQASEPRYEGPSRQIARRGTEIFVAAGKELRWSELGRLREAGEEFERKNGRFGLQVEEGEEVRTEQAYRVLKSPVSRPITQLAVSPSGHFIAILTSHTCHIAILPSSTHLRSGDTTPLRLKTFQVGPTAHVLEQAPLVSALWHPLSPTGNCLVTVTKDACVRMWELDRENRSTFDEPSLAVDLKKLANATSTQEDFSASKYGVNKGFSPDSAEMQVAAACLGGHGQPDEHGWAGMTLWVAMSEGDVYALCPFLPSRWRAPESLIPSLSTSVVAKSRAITQASDVTESERRTADQQSKWLTEVDTQDPMTTSPDGLEIWEVYTRPERLPAIPKLQGPFYVGSEMDIGEITDVFVIPPKVDMEALFDDEEGEPEDDRGLSVGIVCVATSTSKVHVCLDLDGVEAQWLPSKRSRSFTLDDEDEKDLLLFETIDLSHTDFENEGWLTFSASPFHRYEVLATTPSGVYSLDFKAWSEMLEDELATSTESGMDFRLDVLVDSARSTLSNLIAAPSDSERSLNATITLFDANLGYLILTSDSNTTFSVILDIPTHSFAPDTDIPVAALPAPEPRVAYQPSDNFYATSQLPALIKTATEKKLLGSDLKSQVRFSGATLQLLTEAHRLLSADTHRLGVAAADLFRRLERMRAEMQEQVKRVREILVKVDAVVGEEEALDDYEGDEGEDGEMLVGKERLEVKVNESSERTVELQERVDALRKKMARLGGQELSAREKAFAEEVRIVKETVDPDEEDATTGASSIMSLDDLPSSKRENERERESTLAARFQAVIQMRERLVEQAEETAERVAKERDDGKKGSAVGVTGNNEFRKRQLAQVMGMLERETALVEGVTERLARLSAA